MPRLFLVRHAQASFFSARYDALSPLGHRQSAALGAHLAEFGPDFETVFVGPRQRHRETLAAVADAYRARGRAFPEPVRLEELDEHHGAKIMKGRLGDEPGSPELAAGPVEPEDRAQAIKDFFRSYDEIVREWARGLHELEGVETWAGFRARTLAGLDRMCSGPGEAPRIAFTSGGYVSSAAGWLLGLDEDRVIDLSLVVLNTALTEVSWSGRRRRLVSLNTLPHLTDPSMLTPV